LRWGNPDGEPLRLAREDGSLCLRREREQTNDDHGTNRDHLSTGHTHGTLTFVYVGLLMSMRSRRDAHAKKRNQK